MAAPTTREIIKHARFVLKLTQEEAGQLVGVTRRAWEYWEKGAREMPTAAFELFIAKISGQIRSGIAPNHNRELVVVTANDGYTPIDVVSNENFLSLTLGDNPGTFVISSLAIDGHTGKTYKHLVQFSEEHNTGVISAACRWRDSIMSH